MNKNQQNSINSENSLITGNPINSENNVITGANSQGSISDNNHFKRSESVKDSKDPDNLSSRSVSFDRINEVAEKTSSKANYSIKEEDKPTPSELPEDKKDNQAKEEKRDGLVKTFWKFFKKS